MRGNTATDIYTRCYIHILMAEMDVSIGMRAVFHPMRSGSRLVVTRVEAPSRYEFPDCQHQRTKLSEQHVCVQHF